MSPTQRRRKGPHRIKLTVDAWLEARGKEVPFSVVDDAGNRYYPTSPGEAVRCRGCGRIVMQAWRRGMAGKTGVCRDCAVLDDSHKKGRTR